LPSDHCSSITVTATAIRCLFGQANVPFFILLPDLRLVGRPASIASCAARIERHRALTGAVHLNQEEIRNELRLTNRMSAPTVHGFALRAPQTVAVHPAREGFATAIGEGAGTAA
jgi:hypothetical protein